MADPVLRIQSQLTERDLTLLGWLVDHGVLTSFQISNALFGSVDFAQRRLRRLCEYGVLDRFRPQKPDGGTYPYHYVAAQLGVDVIAAQRDQDVPRRDEARRRRWHLTRRANLPHRLGVNGFFTDLAGHARTHPGTALVRWWPAGRCQRMGAFAIADDPIEIRAYIPSIRPDGHGIWHDHATVVPFFLEFDLDTEDHPRLVSKLDGYVDLYRTLRRVWPVLYSFHSTDREATFHTRLAAAGTRLPVATTARDHVIAHHLNPAEAVWWLRGHPGRRTLADLPTSGSTTATAA